RELRPHGQLFYLHNRISDIFTLANKVRKMVPDAKVIVVHGRMNHEQIEDAMIDFNKGLANVMICTTIIENGLDIPSANTIIVEDSDRFGLAQLYQIKGRVGRGDRLAYAYLFYNPKKILNPAATKRLSAIKEFVELGSGYRIALRDLSIRGAGDILGSEQAGFIETVGMDMYLHLLQEALKEKETGIV
ncbi:transcription-repair coupling factor, partial [bacterium]|nr:transcription-repair coupling factor [bacterium]